MYDVFSAKLEAAGLPYAPIVRPEQLMDDVHLKASGGLVPMQTEDGLTDGYVLRTYHGYYFGLCYNGTAHARWYRLRLRFDRSGLLEQYKITRDETGTEDAAPSGTAHR